MIAIGVRLIWRSAANPAPLLDEGPCRIESVLDDGAMVLKPGVKLRLTGIHDLGAHAPAFIEAFVGEVPVRLEFDKERIDSAGVYYGYVWVDERLLNEALVREGLARADASARIASGMKTRLRHAETAARAAGRGRWAAP